MSYQEYWHGDPLMVGAFRKAEKMRQERMDAEAWVQGAYFKAAIESSIGNAFLPKGHTPAKYPEQPYLTRQRELEKQTEEQQIAFAKLYMMQMVEAGKNWGKNKE